MNGSYRSFAELESCEQEGRDYRRVSRVRPSPLLVIAPHGGGIEPGTSEIAAALAGECHSLYLFEGLKENGNDRLHLPSTAFDEPLGLELVQAASWVTAVHGCVGGGPQVWVGGQSNGLRQAALAELNRAGFPAKPDNGGALAGRSPTNICNRGRAGASLQLEISEGLRRLLFKDLDRSGREQFTPVFPAFIQPLQVVLEDWLGRHPEVR